MVNSQQNNNIEMIVSEAKRVITPLSPISILLREILGKVWKDKHLTEIATWLKDIRDVDIYPNYRAIENAVQHGEIDEEIFGTLLNEAIQSSNIKVETEFEKRYIDNIKHIEPISDDFLNTTMRHRIFDTLPKVSNKDENQDLYRPKSADSVNAKGERLIDEVDMHMIKWSKLYLDQFQSSWTMPKREQGFLYCMVTFSTT